jgi:hypothetical protein
MNNKNNNWKWNAVAIAATVAAAAAPALAQDETMRATIPFAFSINNGGQMAPGDYIVTQDRNVWTVRSQETLKAVKIANPIWIEGKEAEQPSLTFDCLAGQCRLRAIRMGYGTQGAELPPPRVSDKAQFLLVSVALKPGH